MSQIQIMWDSRPLVANFAQRELKARYRRSLLGWMWSLIHPLTTILTYSLVFAVILRAPAPEAGDGSKIFALYLFSGLVPWTLFSTMVNGPMDWLAGVAELLRKIQFPADAAIFGGAAAGAVQSLIEAGILLLIMFAIGNWSWAMLQLPYVLVSFTAFGLGMGFMLSIANAHFRDVKYLVGVALNVLFFLVPIVYPPDMPPAEKWGLPLRDIINANPLVQFVGAARDATYFGEFSSPGRLLYIGVVGAVVFVVGWTVFVKKSIDIAEEL
ncbi:MAG: ABC transporter permease [Actinomycetia bacterium]|nr:ABC transporter permease [Actinomycetes bacterium]